MQYTCHIWTPINDLARHESSVAQLVGEQWLRVKVMGSTPLRNLAVFCRSRMPVAKWMQLLTIIILIDLIA